MKRNQKQTTYKVCAVCMQEITEDNINACPTCEGWGCEVCLYTGYCPGCRQDEIDIEVTIQNRKRG